MTILTDTQTQVNQVQKAGETAVSTPPQQRRVNDQERAARREKLAAMPLVQFNDALFG